MESNGVGKNAERQVASAESRPVAPVQSLLAPEQLVEMLSRIVKGQDAALERVAHVVCAQRAKAAPKQPGTIMLLGPTGTGKTFTVEALPAVLEELGQPGSHVVRVDCNELTQPFQVSRLIGAPPGYVGYDSKPRLLEQLEKPGCILLLDEVDKAHPSVLVDVLLNLIDKGRLSSPNGSTIYAEHAVIAMTSNLAVDELALRLHQIPLENRWVVQRICRELLADEGVTWLEEDTAEEDGVEEHKAKGLCADSVKVGGFGHGKPRCEWKKAGAGQLSGGPQSFR